MINNFSTYFTNKAISVYCAGLLIVTLLFLNYSMSLVWFVFGLVSVCGFFYFSNRLTISWGKYEDKTFARRIFITALVIRVVYVLFSYFFFEYMTGSPFEFCAADSMGYNGEAEWIVMMIDYGDLTPYWAYIGGGYSDMGYPFYLGIQYWITGNSILIARLLKALYGAYLCLLVYRLAFRNFGESTGRMAGIFVMLMPNLIYYCGMHLKETEMVFLTVWYVERADNLLRSHSYNFMNIFPVLILAVSLFFFRTALGAVALMAFFTALVFSESKLVGWKKKVSIGVWLVACMLYMGGTKISNEVNGLVQNYETNQESSMSWRAERKGGNSFAKYAGASVFAPFIFTIPFPTMVDTPNQDNQRMIHGGNYVKNITSFFTILALLVLFFRKKNWRKYVLIIAFLCGYLGVIAMSSFAHSERFHLPALPFALILAAYGISEFKNKDKLYFNLWLVLIFVAMVGWNWFKLAGRGFE